MDNFFNSTSRLAAMPADLTSTSGCRHELRFMSLFDVGRAFSFPCDAAGEVKLHDLTARQRQSLERVLVLVGREYAAPQLVTLAT
jgi:hypothetical protein